MQFKFDMCDARHLKLDFESTWRMNRKVVDSQLQTDVFPQRDSETQTTERQDKEIQTEATTVEYELKNDTSKALKSFLATAAPLVEKMLERNALSSAFEDYEASWEEETNAITCLHQLSYNPALFRSSSADDDAEEAPSDYIGVTGVDWNSSGSLLAVCFGHLDHIGWCVHAHDASLCVWNVFSTKMNPNKPAIILEVSNCVMCCAFHPSDSSILAGGTFNGEILIWDVSKEEEPLIAVSPSNDYTHREPISKVMWVQEEYGGKTTQLLSVSADGKVLVWSLVTKYASESRLELLRGYTLLAQRKGAATAAVAGATAFSGSRDNRTTFVAGTEGGRLYKCHIEIGPEDSSSKHMKTLENTKEIIFKNPINFAFEPHQGPVYSVECSPFHRNMFLTCGTDTSIRLYNLLKPKALINLTPSGDFLLDATWSPVRPCVFACASADGHLYIFDLIANRLAPVISLDAGTRKSAVQCVRFHHKHRDLLVTGDNYGVVKVWRLSDVLARENPRERAFLESLGSLGRKQEQ